MLRVAIGVLAGLLVLYGVSIVALWFYARRHPSVVSVRDTVSLLPNVLRLARRLAADSAVPRRARIGLVLLIAYVALPVDLIPDVVPLLGHADDVIVIALVLRYVVRTAGPQALADHWPGTPEGLVLVRTLAGLRTGKPLDPL